MKAFIKNNLQSGLFSSIVLWLMIWGGYNTGIERVLSPGFPHNFSDLIHGIRAFFPILAGLLAVLLLLFKKREISKKFFLTPMGMLMIYAVFGIIFSVFSPSPLISLYWGVSFISVIVVLLATFKNLPGIVYTNWLVAIILTLLLLFLFFSHIGVIQSLTLESFFCNARPY